MGEPDNALVVYMNRPDRIRSVPEYYLGEKLPKELLDPAGSEPDAVLGDQKMGKALMPAGYDGGASATAGEAAYSGGELRSKPGKDRNGRRDYKISIKRV